MRVEQLRHTRRASGNDRSATRQWDKSNLEAATIIASNPDKHQGALQQWADVILSKAAAPKDSECGPLFRTAGTRQAA